METDYNANEQLRSVIAGVRQEAASIQVQGQALTEAEKQRVDQINAALPLLEEALSKLSG